MEEVQVRQGDQELGRIRGVPWEEGHLLGQDLVLLALLYLLAAVHT